MPSCYRIGSATVDITPPLGVPCLGHKPRHLPISGIHDPLFARAACIEANTEKVVIVSADAIGFADSLLGPGRNFVSDTKQAIAHATGVPSSNIMLACNHIHSSPETVNIRPLAESYPNAQFWLESLQQALVQSAAKTCNEMVDAELKIARGSTSGLTFNRRGDSCLDEEVLILLFECADKRELIFANYACHPVIMQAQELVSADYVGVMIRTLKEKLPRLWSCLFLLGACGDIDPYPGPTQRFSDAEIIGCNLAEEVVRLVTVARDTSARPALVKAASTAISFPSRPLPPVRIANLASSEEMQVRLQEGTGPFIGELQLIRIGEAFLIGLPGEIFCVTGKLIKAICDPFMGIPIGCANGYLGYFAPPEAWEKGGYETELGPWSKVGPQATALALHAIEKLLPELGGDLYK